MFQQTESEYNRDNGYKSRKFLLSLISMITLVVLGVLSAVFNWNMGMLETVATSVVTIVLGYSGISATRSVIPRYAQNRTETVKVTSNKVGEPERRNDSIIEPMPEEGDA